MAPQSRRSSDRGAACCAITEASTSGCWRRWWWAARAIYTDLAKAYAAKARGHSHLRVDGEFLPTEPWPRIDRFKEHNDRAAGWR